MGHITVTKEIAAPVEAVFAYVDDHKNTTKYMQGLTRWKPTTDKVHGKDAEFEVVMKAGPMDLGSVVHITDWKENATIAWKSISGFKQTGKWAFKKKGESACEATLDMEYDLGGGIAGRMVGKVAEPAVRHNLTKSVEALKETTEKLKAKTPAKAATAKRAPAGKSASKTSSAKR